MPAVIGDSMVNTKICAWLCPVSGKGWKENPNSCVLMCGPSGTGKSMAYSFMMEEKMKELKVLLTEFLQDHLVNNFTMEAAYAKMVPTRGRLFAGG